MRPAECCFRPDKDHSLGNSFSIIHCHCCIKRAPTTPVKEEISHENWRFLSIRLSVFSLMPFKNAQVANPCREHTVHFHRNLTFSNFEMYYSKCSFADSRCLICELRIFKVPYALLSYSSKNNLLHYGCKSTQKKKRKIEQTEGYLNQQSLRASQVL